jgi:hypothetical protein
MLLPGLMRGHCILQIEPKLLGRLEILGGRAAISGVIPRFFRTAWFTVGGETHSSTDDV